MMICLQFVRVTVPESSLVISCLKVLVKDADADERKAENGKRYVFSSSHDSLFPCRLSADNVIFPQENLTSLLTDDEMQQLIENFDRLDVNQGNNYAQGKNKLLDRVKYFSGKNQALSNLKIIQAHYFSRV